LKLHGSLLVSLTKLPLRPLKVVNWVMTCCYAFDRD